jgi:transposase
MLPAGTFSVAHLLAPDASVCVDGLDCDAGGVIRIAVRSPRADACCPVCGQTAIRVHSAYVRSLADLAWRGLPVRLLLHVRRFRCLQPKCPRVLFAERFGALAPPYARRTARLTRLITRVGMALGGEAGARLLPEVGAAASADTVLRSVQRAPRPSLGPLRVLGVDDWARRRGHTYGTVLVDLEARKPVDLLPDREAASFAQWLREHPGVQIITRDRAEAYAQGARQGAPDAVQVADRWHLLKNVGDLLERLLHRYRAALAQAADVLVPTASGAPTACDQAVPPSEATAEADARRALRAARHAAAQARYDSIRALRAQGLSIEAIGARVGVSRATVHKNLRADTCPTRAPRRTKIGTLTTWDSHLRTRWQQGCRDAVVLWREIKAQGFAGSVRAVQRHVARWQVPDDPHDRRRGPRVARSSQTRSADPPAVTPPSPRQARWWLLLPATALTSEQARYVGKLTQNCTPLRAAQDLAVEFGRLLKRRDVAALEPWLARAIASEHPEFRDFAAGLRRDQAAVEAAIREIWSNGQTEGQITKLKMLKRQMYGRASVSLLRQRLLGAV